MHIKQPKTFSALLCIPITLLFYVAAYYISCSTINRTFTQLCVKINFLHSLYCEFPFVLSMNNCKDFTLSRILCITFTLLCERFLHLCTDVCFPFHFNKQQLSHCCASLPFHMQTTKTTFICAAALLPSLSIDNKTYISISALLCISFLLSRCCATHYIAVGSLKKHSHATLHNGAQAIISLHCCALQTLSSPV